MNANIRHITTTLLGLVLVAGVTTACESHSVVTGDLRTSAGGQLGNLPASEQEKAPNASASPSSSAEPPMQVQTTLVRIIDGDTIAVQPVDGLADNGDRPGEHIVRLLGLIH